MMEEDGQSSLTTSLAKQIAGVPAALVPRSIKALDRLIAAAIDIPVAWLTQQRSRIDAQSTAYQAVESAVGTAVATEAANSPEIVQEALNVLVRKSYRRQQNVEAVGCYALEDLREFGVPSETGIDENQELDEDWLNIFERYAENASTDRVRRLWGRVLAGEIRKPGHYSLRTLRFLSEMSQSDSETFAELSHLFFGDFAPRDKVIGGKKDIGHLIRLETIGLLQGVTSDLATVVILDHSGEGILKGTDYNLHFMGDSDESVRLNSVILSSVALELLSLIPDRDELETSDVVVGSIEKSHFDKICRMKRSTHSDEECSLEVLWERFPPEDSAGAVPGR